MENALRSSREVSWRATILAILVVSAMICIAGCDRARTALSGTNDGPRYGWPPFPRLQVMMWTSDGTIIAADEVNGGRTNLLAVSLDGAVHQIAAGASRFETVADGPLKNEITYIAKDSRDGPSIVKIATLDGKVRASRSIPGNDKAVFAGWKDGKLIVLESTQSPYSGYGYGLVFSSDFAQQRKLALHGMRRCYSGQFSPLKKGHLIILGKLNKRDAFVDADLSTGKVNLIALTNTWGNWRCYDSGRLYYQTEVGIWVMDPATGRSQILMPRYGQVLWPGLSWDRTREVALGVDWKNGGAFWIDPQARQAKRFADVDRHYHPVLAPDGSSSAYIHDYTDLVLLHPDGSRNTLFKVKERDSRAIESRPGRIP